MRAKMNLIEFAHERFLAIQRVYRFTQTDHFQTAEEKATTDQYKQLRKYIEIQDLMRLKRLVKVIIQDRLELKPVLKLRKIASQYKIQNYNLLTKDQLIYRIKDARKDS